MISNFEVIFKNESRVQDFAFWSELGLSANNKVLRLKPRGRLIQKVFGDNEWRNFEKVVLKDTTAVGGEIRQEIHCTPRKKYTQKIQNGGVFLKVNLDVDISRLVGNLPSLLQQYTMENLETKINMMVGLIHKIEVPKACYCAKFTEVTLSKEIMEVENDFTPNPIFNIFRLHLIGKREDEELRKLGILK